MRINLTAEEWDLYTASMDCSMAADYLNKTLNHALAQPSKEDAWSMMAATMAKFSRFGACDTEPRSVARYYIDKHFDSRD